MHSLRRTAVIEIFENKQDLRLAQAFLGHKNILTTSNYLQDSKRSIQDQLRECLC
jgi:site-specific recombinase XerD